MISNSDFGYLSGLTTLLVKIDLTNGFSLSGVKRGVLMPLIGCPVARNAGCETRDGSLKRTFTHAKKPTLYLNIAALNPERAK